MALLSLVLGCETPDEITLVTFNAGLSELFVADTAERAPRVAEAVAELDADVVCLQEVWAREHVDAVIAATTELPFVIAPEPAQELVAGECDAVALAPLADCVAAACPDPPLADCILSNCSAEFDAQEGDCGVCLASNLGSTIDDIVGACTTETGRFQYGGSYGLVLLSREPLVELERVELDAALNRRAVLRARLESGLVLSCTHLTALEDVPYPADDGSWEQEQDRQIDALVAALADDPAPRALLGDLNLGPDEAPMRFERLLALGLGGVLEGTCTFCSDNPLVDREARSVTIDHILVDGGETTPTRILDGGRLSDHYGVSARITLEN